MNEPDEPDEYARLLREYAKLHRLYELVHRDLAESDLKNDRLCEALRSILRIHGKYGCIEGKAVPEWALGVARRGLEVQA